MLTRPSFFDVKYNGLDTNERFRQSERDKMLYDMMEATEKSNNENYNYGTYNETTSRNYYKNNVDDFIRDDEIEHRPKTRKQELKDEYARLRYRKDKLIAEAKYGELGTNLTLLDMIVAILAFALYMGEIISGGKALLLFGGSVLLSIIFTTYKKSVLQARADKLDDRLTEIREELHQINAKNKKSRETSRKKKIQKAREEFVDNQVSML